MLEVDEKNNIYLTRGDTGIFDITLKNGEGEPYVTHEGDTLRFMMIKKRGSGDYIIDKQIPIDTCVLEIEPEETKPCKFGDYCYDVEFTDYEGHISTIIQANFKVGEEA